MGLSDDEFIKMNIANLNSFRSSLKKASLKVSDLSIPMGEIARDFYKSEKAIFNLRGPGGYQDLNKDYKIAKAKGDKRNHPASVYPILKRSGRLEHSITEAGSPESILHIGRTFVEIGSTVPYGIVHNSDLPRKKMPQRKFLFIGPESRQFGGDKNFGGRPMRWKNIIEYYVKSVMGEL